jgi:hypothetical protein
MKFLTVLTKPTGKIITDRKNPFSGSESTKLVLLYNGKIFSCLLKSLIFGTAFE